MESDRLTSARALPFENAEATKLFSTAPWRPERNDTKPYVVIAYRVPVEITLVVTMGDDQGNKITAFTLEIMRYGTKSWTPVLDESGQVQVSVVKIGFARSWGD